MHPYGGSRYIKRNRYGNIRFQWKKFLKSSVDKKCWYLRWFWVLDKGMSAGVNPYTIVRNTIFMR